MQNWDVATWRQYDCFVQVLVSVGFNFNDTNKVYNTRK